MSYSMDHQIKNHSQIRFHKKSLKWVKPWKWGMKLIAYCSMFFSRTMDQNFVVYENESWFHYGIYSWKLGVEKSIGSWNWNGANCRDRWLKKRNMAWHYKWLLSTSYKRWSHTELQGLASCTSLVFRILDLVRRWHRTCRHRWYGCCAWNQILSWYKCNETIREI